MDMLYAMLSSVEVLYRNCTYLNDFYLFRTGGSLVRIVSL